MSDDTRDRGEDAKLEEELRAFRGPEPPDSVWDGIEERIDAKPRSAFSRRWVWGAIAATVLVGVTALLVSWQLRRDGGPDAEWHPHAIPPRSTASLPGDDAAFREISLGQINIMMSKDPEKLLDHLESQSRPLRTSRDTLTPLSEINGA